MDTIGLFEAKTKFSEICARVEARREAVLVTRRGKPLVKIEPVRKKSKPASVWDARAQHVKQHGPLTEDFSLPARAKQTWSSPLDK